MLKRVARRAVAVFLLVVGVVLAVFGTVSNLQTAADTIGQLVAPDTTGDEFRTTITVVGWSLIVFVVMAAWGPKAFRNLVGDGAGLSDAKTKRRQALIVSDVSSEVRIVDAGGYDTEVFLGLVRLKNVGPKRIKRVRAEIHYREPNGDDAIPHYPFLAGTWSPLSPHAVDLGKSPEMSTGPVDIDPGEESQLYVSARKRGVEKAYGMGPESIDSLLFCCALYRMDSLGPFRIAIHLYASGVEPAEHHFQLIHEGNTPRLSYLDSRGRAILQAPPKAIYGRGTPPAGVLRRMIDWLRYMFWR